MIISRAGDGRAIYAAHWSHEYASYWNAGGYIVARIRDGASFYIQPGDEAADFDAEMQRASDAADAAHPDDSDAADEARGAAWDAIMAERGDLADLWEPPSEAGGAPSSDGGFWGFYA
jgi:hypothetical protein